MEKQGLRHPVAGDVVWLKVGEEDAPVPEQQQEDVELQDTKKEDDQLEQEPKEDGEQEEPVPPPKIPIFKSAVNEEKGLKDFILEKEFPDDPEPYGSFQPVLI